MSKVKRRRARPARREAARRSTPKAGVLARRLAALEAARRAERERHARQLAALRRATDRKLAAMVREIALLRHHQARAEALARIIAERDAALAGQTERIARLETLLRTPPEMR